MVSLWPGPCHSSFEGTCRTPETGDPIPTTGVSGVDRRDPGTPTVRTGVYRFLPGLR